jgi:flagellar basal body-associated protein FliL
MKQGFSKIIIITLVLTLALIIAGSFYWFSKKTVPILHSTPAELAQFNQFPVKNNDYRITYDSGANTLTIVPNIPFDVTQAPQYFLQTYWNQYQNYGKEALIWLDTHQMDQSFRTNYGVQIIWWGQEWWPAGQTAPKN